MDNQKLIFQGRLSSEDDLPKNLEYGRHSVDARKTWLIGWVWHVWTGEGWFKGLATKTAPPQAVSQ